MALNVSLHSSGSAPPRCRSSAHHRPTVRSIAGPLPQHPRRRGLKLSRPSLHAKSFTTLPTINQTVQANGAKFSSEFQRACDAQLRQLQASLRSCSGLAQQNSNFSVFVRVPHSLEQQELSLQRIAYRPSYDNGIGVSGFDESTPLVQLKQEGQPETEPLIETWLNQHPRFELPGDTEMVIYPLTFTPAQPVPATVDVSVAESEQQQQQASRKRDGTLLGLLVAEAGGPDPGMPGADEPCVYAPPLAFAEQSATLLETTCECLTMTCALELRAALERATLLKSQQHARALVQEARKPLSALRTFSAMLQYRLPNAQDPASDMASGIVVQGDQLHAVLQQLQTALHPSSGQHQFISESSDGD